MKLFTKEEMKRLEQAAERNGVGLGVLMEGAGLALAEEAERRFGPLGGKRAVLLCGSGNNGGDGFVCARHLAAMGAACTVLLVQGGPQTGLAQNAFSTLPETAACLDVRQRREEACRAVEEAELLIDCVFGFGFRGSLSGDPAEFLRLSNRSGAPRLAADLPSGVECDTGRVSPNAFRADVTVAFTAPKPAHCSYPAKEYCGETVTRQVGVPAILLEAAETRFFETDLELPRRWLREPGPQSNKGDLGKLLLVCGSYGMAGACVMAARAALRCGVGLLRIAADRRIYPILAQAVPEAVFTVLDWETRRQESRERLCEALENSTACLLGCGLGELAETVCPTVFAHCAVPLVVDADGLNFCARHPGVLEEAEAPLILTPHPGEMARLCGDPISEIQADRLGAALMKARETGAVVVLKGAATVTAAPDGRCALNPTGNPGMAKGGSGDVLAGMTASFLAQGIPAFEAAVSAVYLHGMAGDLCARRLGTRAMLPTDLPELLPEVFRTLQNDDFLVN